MHNIVIRLLYIHLTLMTHYKKFVSDHWLELNFEMASTISKIPTGTNRPTLYPSNDKSKKPVTDGVTWLFSSCPNLSTSVYSSIHQSCNLICRYDWEQSNYYSICFIKNSLHQMSTSGQSEWCLPLDLVTCLFNINPKGRHFKNLFCEVRT